MHVLASHLLFADDDAQNSSDNVVYDVPNDEEQQPRNVNVIAIQPGMLSAMFTCFPFSNACLFLRDFEL